MTRLAILLALCALARAGDADLERARARIRALEDEVARAIARAAPAVGAVTNFATALDPATGAVRMVPRSIGSGVVISKDGFFLTNVHVVENAGYLTVTLPDGASLPASVYADTSEGQVKGDIALLRLRGRDRFDFVDWRAGNPQRLPPGSFVFAMGNPHGHAYDGTPVVTMGILSGKGRAAAEAGYLYVDAIQTDAEINPGNSGGPLFDARGNLIGINGLMNSRQGRSNSGVGFAIPIDQVRMFLHKLLRDEGGGAGYGFHGLDVDSAPGEQGAVVKRVARGSPAAEAGLREADVIIRVNREKVANRTDFVNILGKLPEGTRVLLAYRRDRRARMADFRLTSYEEYLTSIGRSPQAGRVPLPLNERGYLGIHWAKEEGGLRVTKVMAESGAERAGLQPGDLLQEVEETAVGEPKALLELLARYGAGETVRVAYTRGTSRRQAKVELCDAARMAGVAE